MVLTNAIYFKAAWNAPFEPENTARGEFTLPDGGTTQVDMMNQIEMLPYAEGVFTRDELAAICHDAYTFPVPLEQVDGPRWDATLEHLGSAKRITMDKDNSTTPMV